MKKYIAIAIAFAVGVVGGGGAGWKIGRTSGQMGSGLPVIQITDTAQLQNQQALIADILEKSGMGLYFQPDAATGVQIYTANITAPDAQDKVVLLQLGPRNSIIAVYTPDGGEYSYVDDIDGLYGVDELTIIPVSGENRDMILLEEGVNQEVGSFEKLQLLKAYMYHDDNEPGLEDVINLPIGIDAVWNSAWTPGVDLDGLNEWQRIVSRSEYAVKEGDPTALDLTTYQTFYLTEKTPMQQAPRDGAYTVQDERVVENQYFWSSDWFNFILDEGIIKSTGERVGIAEILAHSPYSLAGFAEDDVGVLRSDGSYEFISEDEVELQHIFD